MWQQIDNVAIERYLEKRKIVEGPAERQKRCRQLRLWNDEGKGMTFIKRSAISNKEGHTIYAPVPDIAVCAKSCPTNP